MFFSDRKEYYITFEQPIILYISKPQYLLTSFLALLHVYGYYLYYIHTNFSLRVYFQYINFTIIITIIVSRHSANEISSLFCSTDLIRVS